MTRNNQDYVTPGGRASICKWTLSFTFLLKFQAVEAMNKLLEYGIPGLHYQEDMPSGSFSYTITIPEMCWAGNLKDIAEILESVDYPDTCGEYDNDEEGEKSNDSEIDQQGATVDRDAFMRP